MDHLAERFQDATREEQVQIVNIGLQCWDILQAELQKVQELDSTKLIEKWKEEGKKEGRREGEKEMRRLVREKEDRLEDLESQRISLERKLERAVSEKQKEIDELEKKWQRESEREKEVISKEAALAERAQNMKSIKEYEIQIAQLQAKEDWQRAYNDTQKELEKLRSQMETKVQSSYEIGQEGEEESEAMLRKIPEWDCEKVSKEKHKGDFRMVSRTKKTFILDSKKYKDNVQKKERDKLISDVDGDATVSGGIMISLNSNISTKENCQIETTPGKKPICYLNFVGMAIDAKIAYLSSTLKFLEQYVGTNDEREKSELLDRMREAHRRIGELKHDTENIRNKAKEVYESLKINATKIQTIMDFILQDPSVDEKEPAKAPRQKKVKNTLPSPTLSV